jgi:hypothetical protein
VSVTSPATLPPVVADIKAWSRVDFGSLDSPFSDQDLQVQLDRAIDYLVVTTGRPWDATMPAQLVPIAQEATQLRVEQQCFESQGDYAETANDELIQSFSAGNYSETRHEPGRSRYAGLTTGIPEINPNKWLNRDLWLLCTPQMQEYWGLAINGQSPFAGLAAIETTEVDWGNYDGLYPYSYGVGMRSLLVDPMVWGA